MRTVIVVTHGKQQDGELNSLGYEQCAWVATRVAELLPDLKLDLILSSPLSRCIDTANQVAMKLGLEDPRIKTDNRLMDKNEARQPEDLTEIVNEAEGDKACILLCGHGDLARCFPGQIDPAGLAQDNTNYFKHGPAIAIYTGMATTWQVKTIEILQEQTRPGWITVTRV